VGSGTRLLAQSSPATAVNQTLGADAVRPSLTEATRSAATPSWRGADVVFALLAADDGVAGHRPKGR
jgi:hypothetical protein